MKPKAALGFRAHSGWAVLKLEKTFASHAMIHTAEGMHYRSALARASKSCGLTVIGIQESDLFQTAASLLKLKAADMDAHLGAVGRELGPPWTQDEKRVALAAWIALA